MTRQPPVRSLFWTYAGAFLAVAIVAAFIQGVVLIDVMWALAARAPELEPLVKGLAGELGSAPSGADPTPILSKHQAQTQRFVIAFRDASGQLHFGSRLPSGFDKDERERLQAQVDRANASAATPDPYSRPPWSLTWIAPPLHGGPAPDGSPVMLLALTAAVQSHGRQVGEVAAWRMGPPIAPRLGPFPRLLLSLPLTLIIASIAGLLMSRGVLTRLKELQHLADRVATGDLTVRVVSPVRDEIGQLGESLNAMSVKLSVARQHIEQSDRDRRRLLADISHELATPLTSIRGYAETLLNRAVPLSGEENERYQQHIQRAANRMNLLVQDLLDLARLESQSTQLKPERIDWAALCRNMAEGFAPRFHEAGLELTWDDLPQTAWIVADGRRMEQVVDNLLVNALRYVPRGHHVWVSMSSIPGSDRPVVTRGRHRLVVSDDGPGFPQADLPRVFDRFYSGKESRASAGSGLGLAIVREIVRQHGGEVRAANREPNGASIEIELPFAREVLPILAPGPATRRDRV